MREKKTYISVLSVIACYCVVQMHVNNYIGMNAGWTLGYDSIIIDGICYFAVPLFFMISGANLIDYRQRYDTATFFKKRFFKTVLPFLLWSLLGVVDFAYKGQLAGATVKDVILGILNVRYVETYWFFLPLFAMYLCMPVLSAIENKEKVIPYMIVVGILIGYAMPYYAARTGTQLNDYFAVPMMSGWVTFLIVGYGIDHFEIPRYLRYVIYAIGLWCFYLIVFKTARLTQELGYNFYEYKGVLNLPVLCYAAAIFLLGKQLSGCKAEGYISKLTDFFAKQTFGIYLIHRPLIEVLHKIPGALDNTVGARLLDALCIFIAAGLLVKLLQKIPVIKHLVP